MKIKKVSEYPYDLVRPFPKEDEQTDWNTKDIEDVCEIFNTPLVGAYNWDYTEADNRLRKLYELGKTLNWNGTTQLDWSQTLPKTEYPVKPETIPFIGYEPYEKLTEEQKVEFSWDSMATSLSNFLHGEQGALLVASQLVSCAPTYNAKLYAASQTFDEARHVEVFNRYLQTKIGHMFPIASGLKLLLDKVLSDPRWDLKFIGMQVIIEGLALAAFTSMQMTTRDPLLRELIHYVLRDEARHVTFGINYLEEFVQTLTDEEKEERAQFALEACIVMRDRLVPISTFQKWGWDLEDARTTFESSDSRNRFRNLLFARVLPNLRRIGLITDSVREKYDSLGLLEFADHQDDADIDWARLEQPLDDYDPETLTEGHKYSFLHEANQALIAAEKARK